MAKVSDYDMYLLYLRSHPIRYMWARLYGLIPKEDLPRAKALADDYRKEDLPRAQKMFTGS